MKKSFAFMSLFLLIEIVALAGNIVGMADFDASDGAGNGTGNVYTCSSGGPGSSSCTVSANIGIGDGSGGTSCSVTCNSGYYACCNAYYNKCQCRKEQ